jgi:peptidoglycan/xylan/chitin deacetylase (PgdA/CDA1 family)
MLCHRPLPASFGLLLFTLLGGALHCGAGDETSPRGNPGSGGGSAQTGGAAGTSTGSGGDGGTSNGSGGQGQSGGSETGGAAGSTDDGGGPEPIDDAGAADQASPSDATSPVPVGGLGPWTGKDDVAPSKSPPGGLKPEQVPMFVALGFDDNGFDDGLNWVKNTYDGIKNPAGAGNAGTYDGTPALATFYITSNYGKDTAVKNAYVALYKAGHELGDHTVSHPNGANFSVAQWDSQIQGCIDFLTSSVSEKRAEIIGFRTPFLAYNTNTFTSLKSHDFHYDCSIEEGFQPEVDGTNFFWPYTLDGGSPGHDYEVSSGDLKAIGKYPGLWELPTYPVIGPPDSDAAKYGSTAGLRTRMKAAASYYDSADGKVTGLDWNLWSEFKASKADFVATLEYTLDMRLRSNRAPLIFGTHSDIYSPQYEGLKTGVADRRAAIAAFLAYAAGKPDVRIVSMRQVLDWIRNPVALK